MINDKHGLKVNNRNVEFWKASGKCHSLGRVPSSHKCKERMLTWVPRANRPRDTLRNDTEARQANCRMPVPQLKMRAPTLVIHNYIPGITKICELSSQNR